MYFHDRGVYTPYSPCMSMPLVVGLDLLYTLTSCRTNPQLIPRSTANLHKKLYGTSPYQIEGPRQIHSIPTRKDVVQLVVRLVNSATNPSSTNWSSGVWAMRDDDWTNCGRRFSDSRLILSWLVACFMRRFVLRRRPWTHFFHLRLLNSFIQPLHHVSPAPCPSTTSHWPPDSIDHGCKWKLKPVFYLTHSVFCHNSRKQQK